MSYIRAFIAIEIDESTIQKISELILCLKKSDADVKWATDNQMHLTLKFLGNINQDRIQEISNALNSIAKETPLFIINFSKIGGFPNLNHPAVIWLGIDKGADSLITMAKKIESGLEKAGFKKEERKFTPHLTLARVRTSKNIASLVQLINETNLQIPNETKIDKLTLYQSTLTPKGAIYTPLVIQKLNTKNQISK